MEKQATYKVLDYAPFGMAMSSRSFTGASGYKFGYQGSEKDFDVNQGAYTTHFRMLDTRLGRWWSTDPVVHAKQSPYISMDNNPIVGTDIMGDDVTNGNTREKHKVAKKVSNSMRKLATAKDNFKKFEGTTKNDYKGKEKKVFNQAKKALEKAQSDLDINRKKLNQQIEFEKITDQIIEEFKNTNPEAFKEWNELEINGKIIDVEVFSQENDIQMVNESGIPTGKVTTEGTSAYKQKGSYYITKIKSRLKIQRDGENIKISEMTSVFVHGLGHYYKNKTVDEKTHSEDFADRYEERVYTKKKK